MSGVDGGREVMEYRMDHGDMLEIVEEPIDIKRYVDSVRDAGAGAMPRFWAPRETRSRRSRSWSFGTRHTRPWRWSSCEGFAVRPGNGGR